MSRSTTALDAARWNAVQNRDRSSHSSFIYAVLTTGIFCRPTCPARLARRANVVFFDSAVDATVAGFRPCKRCKPVQYKEDSEIEESTRMVTEACKLIGARGGDVTAGEVAKHVGVSGRHLYSLFKKDVGMTPAAYAVNVRREIQRATRETGGSFTFRSTDYLNGMQVNNQVEFDDVSFKRVNDHLPLWEMFDVFDDGTMWSGSSGSTMSPLLLTPVSACSPFNNELDLDHELYRQFICDPE